MFIKPKNCSREATKLIKKNIKKGFKFGKSEEYIKYNAWVTYYEAEEELKHFRKLFFTNKEIRSGEVRYTLYFIYSGRRGRAYVITFRENEIRVITAWIMGRSTIRKIKKKHL